MPTYLDDPQEYALRAAGLVNAAGAPRTAENYNRASQYIAQGQQGAAPVFEMAMERMLAKPAPRQVKQAAAQRPDLPLPLPPPEPPGAQPAGAVAPTQTPLPPMDTPDILDADTSGTPQTGRHTPGTPPHLIGQDIGGTEAGLGLAALLSVLRGKGRGGAGLGVTLNPRGGGGGAAAPGGGALPGGGGGGGGGPSPGPVPIAPSGPAPAGVVPPAARIAGPDTSLPGTPMGPGNPVNRILNDVQGTPGNTNIATPDSIIPMPGSTIPQRDPNVRRMPPIPQSIGNGTLPRDLYLDGYGQNKRTKPKLEDEVKRRIRLNKQRDQRRSRRSSDDTEE